MAVENLDSAVPSPPRRLPTRSGVSDQFPSGASSAPSRSLWGIGDWAAFPYASVFHDFLSMIVPRALSPRQSRAEATQRWTGLDHGAFRLFATPCCKAFALLHKPLNRLGQLRKRADTGAMLRYKVHGIYIGHAADATQIGDGHGGGPSPTVAA